jgi:hypothetical protein
VKPKLSLIYDTCGCFVFAILAGFIAGDIFTEDISELPTGPQSILYSALISSAALAYLLFRGQVSLSALKLNVSDIKKGVAVGLVLALINLPYGYLFYDKPLPSEYAELISKSLSYVLIFAVFISFIVPIIEELLYREFIFNRYENSMYRYSGYLLSCFLFYWAHNYLIQALVGSLILCCLYDFTKRLGPCVIAHMSWNICWMLALIL